MLKLYEDIRASAAHRVRIALHFKGIAYERVLIALANGDQKTAGYLAVNPQGVVPSLEASGDVFTQSLAILEWLEETCPRPALLPGTAGDRARIRAMALAVAADIHPVQSLRIRTYLEREKGWSEGEVCAWLCHWIAVGLGDLQILVERSGASGRYCYGDEVTLADVVLVPQLVNARRFGCDLEPFDRLLAIDEALSRLSAFAAASPAALTAG